MAALPSQPDRSEFAFGADVKYGLTSNLTLDATVNPDFGQVEADPAVLYLSTFEPFFEERRPFFLKGAGIFSFATNLFYSRRVGRSPQLGGVYDDPEGGNRSLRDIRNLSEKPSKPSARSQCQK